MNRRITCILLAIVLLSTCFMGISPSFASPNYGKAEVYVTSQNGGLYNQRMSDLYFTKADPDIKDNYIKVYPDIKRQEYIGIGGAITESTAYNISKLSPEKQEEIYRAYYSEEGSHYSVLRTHMGSADFSMKSYSYNDYERPDPDLTKFNIDGDRDYLLPAIKRAFAHRPDLKFFAAPWSPPAWMKKSQQRKAGNAGTAGIDIGNDDYVLPQYYEAYANYFVKYLQEYKKEGIDVYSISLQNEAMNNPPWEACNWKPDDAANFIGNYLGPALEKSGFDPQLLIWDWDKGNDPMHGVGMVNYVTRVLNDKKAAKYVDGVAFHWYAGNIISEIQYVPMWSRDFDSLDKLQEKFPEINFYATEACQEKGTWRGSWTPAQRYIYDIINDFEHGAKSWIDWNMVLDHKGGPLHDYINVCNSPILLDENGNIEYQPAYYVLQQLSREVQPGTRRIETETDVKVDIADKGQRVFDTYKKSTIEDIAKTAVIDDKGNISLMIGNVSKESKFLTVIDGERALNIRIKPNSLTTIKYSSNYDNEGSFTGWKKDGSNWYYLENNQKLKGTWRFLPCLDQSGRLVKNWKYFDEEGVNRPKLYTEKGKIWYSQPGSRSTYFRGWKIVDGKTYCFRDRDGQAYTGLRLINGRFYTFGKDGVLKR